MMSNIFDFEADEQLPTGANVAVKFSLPEGLVRNLSLYAQSTSRSKTEIVREAIENRLRNDPSWCAGLFFFEKNEEKIQNVYDIGLNTGIKEIDNLLNYLNK